MNGKPESKLCRQNKNKNKKCQGYAEPHVDLK